ncbi:MAG: acetylornithine transaminase [Chloroflexi bacterium]|nr:acetylornithine transaminase [Chloroflexota bacterium]
MSSSIEREQQYYMQVSRRLPVVLVRGEGVRVWDEDGKAYLDLVAGIATSILGHGHPKLVEAIREQAGRLVHVSNLYYSQPQIELARLLVENSCCQRVFFGNSGAEANEGAIKVARKWGRVKRGGAYEVITVEDSFHGRTLATLAATGQAKFHKPFEPMPAGFVNVPFNDIAAVKAATNERTAAVLIEVVQGESGVHPARVDYVQALRRWCDEQGLLFMLDEVQTGMGRTGKFFGYEHFGVEPDVIAMAKGLAGGVPIGAVLVTDKANVFDYGDHGSTFGGNPLACAAGVATMKVLRAEGLVENSAVVGRYFLGKLEELQARQPAIAEVRGLGLMLALDTKEERANDIVLAALRRGLILNATGPRTVRMVPPLVLSKSDVDEAVAIIEAAIAEVSQS